jgi:preprotein translocase subunit SecD
VFLAQLGSGTVQGFAMSLAIGNITSLFTSLFISRLIFDFETDVLHMKHVSIGWGIK